jgi:hypothetical protein
MPENTIPTAAITEYTPEEILACLKKKRFLIDKEKDLQKAISETLTTEGIRHFREFDFNGQRRDIIDFMIHPYIGMEVKIGGSKASIYRQLSRYCSYTTVVHLILVTNKAMALPPEIKGTKTYVLNLGRAWL